MKAEFSLPGVKHPVLRRPGLKKKHFPGDISELELLQNENENVFLPSLLVSCFNDLSIKKPCLVFVYLLLHVESH